MRLKELRSRMVKEQIKSRGIRDKRVLEAMLEIPRHRFVLPEFIDRAYDDTPLPILEGQTISQPYMVAWMTELLDLHGDEKVLEIGTGSGYQAAILSKLARSVYTIERIEALSNLARRVLEELVIQNVEVVTGDGSAGLPEHAPYDGIIVTAGAPEVPPCLVEQLSEGARLVIPVGPSTIQMLTVVEKQKGKPIVSEEGSCVFVPLVGKYGWKERRQAS
ncbi:MAG: protein-L-isoaspartate(D-aspartate) O-methyltransferase [Actinomycetota bacterium]|nr:protein-L-isoaspartate(D-aspartate) O-methyltransferase [Actinomycetota bacterium]